MRLLALDPELGQLLEGERLQTAERELLASVIHVEIGEWDRIELAGADPAHLGLLLVDGVLAREVVLGDSVSTELLGPGDIIRPWTSDADVELLPVRSRWNALSRLRLAVLDRRFAVQLGRYPEVNAVIVDRLIARSRRVAIEQAIAKLTRVDDRLIALFWHLAERWGRVVPEGVAVPLALSHRLVGELVGAARPTVSTALGELAQRHELSRREDGTWLLTGRPPADTAGRPIRDVIRQRRTLVPSRWDPSARTAVRTRDDETLHEPS